MRTSLINKVKRIYNYNKYNGILETCKYICVNSFYYHQWAIFEGNLTKNREEVKARIPIEIRLLSNDEKEIDRLTKFWPDTYTPPSSTTESIKKLIMERLAAGEKCIIAEYQDNIIFMNWIGFKNAAWHESYKRKRSLSLGEALIHLIYCETEHRGYGVMSEVLHYNIKWLKNEGYNKLISFVLPNNHASMKVMKKMLGNPANKLLDIKILVFHIQLLSKRQQ